ncbi:MAG TPA: hypothetical protein VEY09_04790 [Pyrinomonadaceae bacterium]|nr:hypothetical protein [Pyrinomonadaceae bacterium]
MKILMHPESPALLPKLAAVGGFVVKARRAGAGFAQPAGAAAG